MSLDQTDLGDRMAVLIVSVRVGERALPLAWVAEEGPTNIGFEGQRQVLERVLAWLPEGAYVLLPADRFCPSADLFAWLDAHGWGYRLRLRSNLLADSGHGEETTTRQLAQGVAERYLPGVRLFAHGVMTNLGILHEAGHPEPWIIAMDCPPSQAVVLDYAARRAIEPMFSDFKEWGFDLEGSQLWHADRMDRMERLALVMALAMHWFVRVGQDDALKHPTPLEKKRKLKRPWVLELQEASPQPGVLVYVGVAPPETVLAKRHSLARLLRGTAR